jgi:hypothetical protein
MGHNEKHTHTLTDASKEVGQEVNTDKTKCMLLSRHRNGGRNHDIKISDRCFENVAQLKYLGTTVTNRNLIQEQIKRRLNSGNACYNSGLNLLSSCPPRYMIYITGAVYTTISHRHYSINICFIMCRPLY